MEKRISGIDIIKILAIILVTSLHFFLNFGFYNQPYIGYGKVIQESIRWISFSCIGLFIMSTGYLQCNKKPTREYFFKIVNYVFIYLCYCILTVIIIHGNENIISNVIYYFLQYKGYFWYMSFFFGLYLLIPYLNMIINNIKSEKDFKIFILILGIIISIPAFVNSIPVLIGENKIIYMPDWWKEFFPIIYYMLGAYFRKYNPKILRLKSFFVLILTSFGIALLDYYFSHGELPKCVGGGYGSIITVIISVSIFSIIYNYNINNSYVRNILSYTSSLTLEIYLGLIISDQATRQIVDKYFTGLVKIYNFDLYIIEVLLNFTISFIVAIFMNIIIRNVKKIFLKNIN